MDTFSHSKKNEKIKGRHTSRWMYRKKTNDKKNCNPINNLPLTNGCKCHLVFNVFINDKFLQL